MPGWLRDFYFHSEPDEGVRPTAKAGDAGFHEADHPLDDHARTASVKELVQLFEAWLLLNHGSGFRLVKDPAPFRNRAAQTARRSRSGGRGWHAQPNAGQYDLTEMHEPRLYNGRLRCYVEDRVSGIPYRVELPWPISAQDTARFQLLPLLQEEGADYI